MTGTSTADQSALALAPYINHLASINDTAGSGNGKGNMASAPWDLSSGTGAAVPFVSASQLDARPRSQQPDTSSFSPSQQVHTPTDSTSIATTNTAHLTRNNPFLNKLRSMVDDPATNDLIRWSSDGDSFLVPNHVRFGDEVLPRFFKHNRFSSFVRQLNMYGFHKVPHLQQGALRSDASQESELWEFKNEYFRRDKPELLAQMQRKKGAKADEEASALSTKGKGREEDGNELALTKANTNETGAIQLASVWNAIQAIQAAQQGINDNIRHLHSSNAELYREAAEQRAKSKKQEDTINKMLRFLAGVFGAQDVGGLGSSERRGNEGTPGQGKDGRRRVVVRPNSRNRRLLIGDSTGSHGNDGAGVENDEDQIVELELPLEGDASIEELTPANRFSEARSNSNSPRDGSPSQRFANLNNSPPRSAAGDLPSISSEVTATPGGGRRISQQAGAQILNALSSGEGSTWLANLFGQQQNHLSNSAVDQAKAASTPGGGSFKLDQQTLQTLQSVLGGMGEGGAGEDDYFDAGATRDEGGRFTYPWSAAAESNGQKTVATPMAELAKSVQKNDQNLTGTTQDAAMVQNALNTLVEGLRIQPGASTGGIDGSGAGMQANGNIPQVNHNSQYVPPYPTSADGSNPPPADAGLDMESLLHEFLNPNSASSDSAMTPGASHDPETSPTYAFSPNTTALGESTTPARVKDEPLSSRSGTSTPDQTASPAGATSYSSRKRKEFEGALAADIDNANAKAKKATTVKEQPPPN